MAPTISAIIVNQLLTIHPDIYIFRVFIIGLLSQPLSSTALPCGKARAPAHKTEVSAMGGENHTSDAHGLLL